MSESVAPYTTVAHKGQTELAFFFKTKFSFSKQNLFQTKQNKTFFFKINISFMKQNFLFQNKTKQNKTFFYETKLSF